MQPIRWLGFSLLAGVFLFFGCGGGGSVSPTPTPTPIPAIQGTFTATGNMVTGRSSSASTLLPNGMVLIAGGQGRYHNPLASAELYDPATGGFTATGSMAKARYTPLATLLPNGKVLIMGVGGDLAANNHIADASAELYDPATGTFTPTGNLVTARCSQTATLLPNGKVLIAGGFVPHSGTILLSAELYDPDTGVFTATGNLVMEMRGHTATLLPNGKVLLAGGAGGGLSAELYDLTTGAFTATGSLGMRRYDHTATLLPNGKVLIAGTPEWAFASPSPALAELYDPATGTFTATGHLGKLRFAHTATLLSNGKVLIAGGNNGLDPSKYAAGVANAELYDPATGTFTASGNQGHGLDSQTATLLPNGKVLIAGGGIRYMSSSWDNAELFDPQNPTPGFPSISFNPSSYAFHQGVAIPMITPLGAGATTWSINPSLPDGLQFNPTTGVITGIPSVITSSNEAFHVSASNGTNSTTAYLWISVLP